MSRDLGVHGAMKPLWLVIFFGCAVLIALVVAQRPSGSRTPRMMPCGHKRSPLLVEKMAEFLGASRGHTCSSETPTIRLFSIFDGQRAYYQSNGFFARTLLELGLVYPSDSVVTMESDGQRWHARMAKQNDLPGHFLLSSDGRIHFSIDGPAATNDLVFLNLK